METQQKKNAASSVPYSKNILNQLTDQNMAIKANKNPSNLVEIPRVNEKYEVNSFAHSNPQYRQNLKTLEIIKNNASG